MYKSVKDTGFWKCRIKGSNRRMPWMYGGRDNYWFIYCKFTFADHSIPYSNIVDILRKHMHNAWIHHPILVNKANTKAEDPRPMGDKSKVFHVCNKGDNDEWMMNMLMPTERQNIPTKHNPLVINGLGDRWEYHRGLFLLQCNEKMDTTDDEMDE